MDFLQQVAALLRIGFIAARQPRQRRAKIRCSLLVKLVLASHIRGSRHGGDFLTLRSAKIEENPKQGCPRWKSVIMRRASARGGICFSFEVAGRLTRKQIPRRPEGLLVMTMLVFGASSG